MVGKDPAGHPARAGEGKGENGMEKILKLLEENARMSVEDIAGITGDTPEAVARKLDEYAQNHVINGYHALVDWEKAGVPRVQAIIEPVSYTHLAKIAVFYAALFQVALYGLFQLKAAVVCAQCNRFCHAKNFLSA